MKNPIKRKAHLAIIALLFLGESLFAGGGNGSGSGPRRVNRPGFVAPVLHVAARALEAVVARQEENVKPEGVHPGEQKMEEPEAAESEASGGDEGLLYLGGLPPEVIVYYVIPYLSDGELGRLALTSRWTAELACEELGKRYTSHIQRTEQRIHDLAQRASSPNYLVSSQATREMGELLASSKILITHEQVEAVLRLLIGDDKHGGLAGDENWEVRQHVAMTIGVILASGKCSEEGRARLLNALIGNNGNGGLAGDRYFWVREDVAMAIGVILASGKCSESECTRLLCELIGVDGHSGLAGDWSYNVRSNVAIAIGKILASEKCTKEEHSRLSEVLNSLA